MSSNTCDIDHLLKLSINKQRTNATLRIEPNLSNSSITRELICAFLSGREICTQCMNLELIDQLIQSSCEDPASSHELVVVSGTPPTDGMNAQFDFSDKLKERIEAIKIRKEAFLAAEKGGSFENNDTSDTNESNKANDTDESTGIDFYNESPFLIVSQDEIVGRVTDPSWGEDGTDVFGQSLPANQGKEHNDLIDDSFQIDRDGNVIALKNGHFTHTGMQLRINPTLEIKDSVDFSTGHIDFPNNVSIHKGVRDRFKVLAQKDIEIQKLVEASTINAVRDIELQSGMAGREIGKIFAGRHLSAGYIDGVIATIAGDCKVSKEITNCNVTIGGALISPNAALRGGQVSMTKGGAIGSIGSAQGVQTEIIIGSVPDIEDKIRLATELKPRVELEIEKQTKAIETFKSSIGKPNAEQETEIWFMNSEIQGLQDQLDKIEAAIERLGQIILEHASHKLCVKSTIFAKTVIWIPGYQIKFDNDIKGELLIELNKARTPVITRNGETEHLNSVAQVIADDRVLPLAAQKQSEVLTDDTDSFNIAA